MRIGLRRRLHRLRFGCPTAKRQKRGKARQSLRNGLGVAGPGFTIRAQDDAGSTRLSTTFDRVPESLLVAAADPGVRR
jgi:hypothetical protein